MSSLKRIAAWPFCWMLYGIGHLASKFLVWNDDSELWVAFWYPLYNRHMLWSSDVQDWAGGDRGFPWGKVSHE